MIAHMVLFTPKASLTIDDKRSFALAWHEVGQEVSTIKRAFVGRSADVDPGYNRSFGDTTYKMAAVLEFESREDLVYYLRHPRHAELGRLFWECCERSVVCEVETREVGADDLMPFLLAGEP